MRGGIFKTARRFIGTAFTPVMLGGILLAVSITPVIGRNPPKIAPPGSTAYGKSLAEWLGLYWRWFYSGASSEESKVGIVQFMPLPMADQVGGSWSPEDPAVLAGHLDVTLKVGTPFVLPEFAWVGERYDEALGWPDDVPMADDVLLQSLSPTLIIDGVTVMTDANKADFYITATWFDPVVVYPEPTAYGSVAAIYYQGCGLVVAPLSVGVHQISLDESFITWPGQYPGFPDGIGLEYHNTWTITVQR